MSPEDFQTQWTKTDPEPEPLITFSHEAVSQLALSEDTKRLLAEIGLPDSAAPFLCFGTEESISLPPVPEVWRDGDERQRVIGCNGSGDPICLHAETGAISYLLHDHDMEARFMNSSVLQLAYTLLAFGLLVRKTNESSGEDAYLDGRIPMEVADEFITTVEHIDPEAIKPGSFWLSSIFSG